MRIAVSDLLFPGFRKFGIRPLNTEYGIEFFYEFGHDYYWDEETAAWGNREFSIHGPCVAVDLADKDNVSAPSAGQRHNSKHSSTQSPRRIPSPHSYGMHRCLSDIKT